MLTCALFHEQHNRVNQTPLELTDPEAVRVLLSEHAFEALAPFFQSARSLSEAATLLEWKLPRLSHWVKKLLNVGLLDLDRVERRRGSAIKYYRTTAPAFSVPYALHDPVIFEDFREGLNLRMEETLAWAARRQRGQENGAYGLLVQGTGSCGTHITEIMPSPQTAAPVQADPPVTYRWDDLNLTAGEAHEFNDRLNQLLEEFRGRSGPQRYLMRLGFARITP